MVALHDKIAASDGDLVGANDVDGESVLCGQHVVVAADDACVEGRVLCGGDVGFARVPGDEFHGHCLPPFFFHDSKLLSASLSRLTYSWWQLEQKK